MHHSNHKSRKPSTHTSSKVHSTRQNDRAVRNKRRLQSIRRNSTSSPQNAPKVKSAARNNSMDALRSKEMNEMRLKPYNVYNSSVLENIIRQNQNSTAGVVLYISNVLPDNNATAAGLRTFGVLRSLKALGFQPFVLTTNRFHTNHQNLIDSYTNLNIPIARTEINETGSGYEEFLKGLANGTYFERQLKQLGGEVDDDQNGIPQHPKLSMVIFDRYVVEEFFGLKTREALLENPVATIIDTQDLHFLRFAREEVVKDFEMPHPNQQQHTRLNDSNEQHSQQQVLPANGEEGGVSTNAAMPQMTNNHPLFAKSPQLIFPALSPFDPNVQRELAPYLRSDFVLTVSENEAILLELLGVPKNKVMFLPITYPNMPDFRSNQITKNDETDHKADQNDPKGDQNDTITSLKSSPNPTDSLQFDQIFNRPFGRRSNAMFIGTMRHPPNVNCVEVLRNEYLPLIRHYTDTINATVGDIITVDIDLSEIHDKAQVEELLVKFRQKLNLLKSTRRPSIHIFGTYMTKEQSNMTVVPTADEIELEQQISKLEHQVNVMAKGLQEIAKLAQENARQNNHNDDNPPFSHQLESIISDINNSPTNLPQQNSYAQKGPLVMKGTAKHAIQTISQYTTLLSPLQFGAGVKGKVIDAWISGTPVVATTITAEGLGVEFETQQHPAAHPTTASSGNSCPCLPQNLKCNQIRSQLDIYCNGKYGESGPNGSGLLGTQWPGVVHNDHHILSLSSLLLNTCPIEWQRQHDKIPNILNSFRDEFGMQLFGEKLIEVGGFAKVSTNSDHPKLQFSPQSLQLTRQKDFIGQMLYHRNNNSQYYMPKYLNVKKELALVKSLANSSQ